MRWAARSWPSCAGSSGDADENDWLDARYRIHLNLKAIHVRSESVGDLLKRLPCYRDSLDRGVRSFRKLRGRVGWIGFVFDRRSDRAGRVGTCEEDTSGSQRPTEMCGITGFVSRE